jgi:hypothetical protein
MTWTGLYPWLLVLHVSSALAFLAVHGVSMGVWWRVRRERDRAKLVPLLELSSSFVTPMMVAGLLLIVSGVTVGIAAAWWFNGQWWLWVSMVLLVVIVVLMNPLVAIPMWEIRRGLGLPTRADRMAGTSPEPVDDAALERLAADRRPTVGAAIAIVGIVLITWLMETKPF